MNNHTNDKENAPAPRSARIGLWISRLIAAIGRVCIWAVWTPPRAGLRAWASMRPTQQLVTGFAAYALIGALLLSLPISQAAPSAFLDNLFNAFSAVSTTGLTTISVSDHYTWLGEVVILVLFQIGGIGFMTISSVFMLARGRALSETREGVLRTGFALPHYFHLHHFLVQVIVFTFACEAIGTAILWWRFAGAGVESPLWSAVFHSISAFATAGFSLNNNSMESFAHDPVVNLTIGTLSYCGAIGFIVVQDVWYSLKLRERMLTFTSKVILWMTGTIFALGTVALFFLEPSVRTLPVSERLLTCAFQTMTASSTAGFNTIPIGQMATPALVVILIAMLVGASPSGTGGGIKTTSVSAILGNLMSMLRGRNATAWFGYEIPSGRVLMAFAACSLYLLLLIAGVLILTITETAAFLPIVFEAASAIGTVGLSMGITGDLSATGKLIIIALMFAGRCGPLTIGLALLRQSNVQPLRPDDLAV